MCCFISFIFCICSIKYISSNSWLIQFRHTYIYLIIKDYILNWTIHENETVFPTRRYLRSPHNTDCEALNYTGAEGQPGERPREERKRQEGQNIFSCCVLISWKWFNFSTDWQRIKSSSLGWFRLCGPATDHPRWYPSTVLFWSWEQTSARRNNFNKTTSPFINYMRVYQQVYSRAQDVGLAWK